MIKNYQLNKNRKWNYYPGICLEKLREATKPSTKRGVLAEI
jgi:hypothetical protein